MRLPITELGCGAKLRFARDGQQAVDYLAGRPPYSNRQENPFPEAMLLDLKMPRMTGFDVLRWLRDRPQNQIVPIVVLSSSFYDADVTTAFQLGAHGFFVKPTGIQDLMEILQTIHRYWSLSLRPRSSSMAAALSSPLDSP